MTVDQQKRIVSSQTIMGGKPCVKGTRISVEHVLDHIAGGWTFEAIIENYPSLTLHDVAACVAYARDVVASENVFPNAA